MSHRRAKQLRRELFPADKRRTLSRRRVSCGEFLRLTTGYTLKHTGFKRFPWPLSCLYGDIVVKVHSLLLKRGSPRQVYQHVKRRRPHGHAKPA